MVRSPSWPSVLLLLAGASLVFMGGVALYGERAVIDERAFADRATSALAEDEVRGEISDGIGDRTISADPALAPSRPVLDMAIQSVVASWRFPAHFHAG